MLLSERLKSSSCKQPGFPNSSKMDPNVDGICVRYSLANSFTRTIASLKLADLAFLAMNYFNDSGSERWSVFWSTISMIFWTIVPLCLSLNPCSGTVRDKLS